MAAGLYMITTNYGALYETCAEYSTYVPYQTNQINLATNFAYTIEMAADRLYTPGVQHHLKDQMQYTSQYYNWERIGNAWTNFLQGALNAKQ